MRGPKEIAFDEQIAPLLDEVRKIASANKINCTWTFFLDKNERGLTLEGTGMCVCDPADAKGATEILQVAMEVAKGEVAEMVHYDREGNGTTPEVDPKAN